MNGQLSCQTKINFENGPPWSCSRGKNWTTGLMPQPVVVGCGMCVNYDVDSGESKDLGEVFFWGQSKGSIITSSFLRDEIIESMKNVSRVPWHKPLQKHRTAGMKMSITKSCKELPLNHLEGILLGHFLIEWPCIKTAKIWSLVTNSTWVSI